jgi:hypothetical protein
MWFLFLCNYINPARGLFGGFSWLIISFYNSLFHSFRIRVLLGGEHGNKSMEEESHC